MDTSATTRASRNTETNELLQRAIDCQRRGDLNDAEALCQRILDLDSRHAAALQLWGMVALSAGRAQIAVNALERATLSGSHPELVVALAEAYRQTGRLNDAGSVLGRSLELAPGWAPSHYALGLVQRDRGELGRALGCFERAVSLAPNVPTFQRELGECLVAVGDAARAEHHLSAALSLNPSSAEAHFALADVQRSQEDHERAVTHYAACLKLQPQHAAAHAGLGASFVALGHEEEAVKSLERALEVGGETPERCFNLASALSAAGRFDEALPIFRRGVELDPTNAAAHSDLVYMLPFRQGFDDQAISRKARFWNDRHAATLTADAIPHARRRLSGRMRIGYVAADLRRHVQAVYTLPLLEHHDRSAFEIFCYSTTTEPDEVTHIHRELVDQFLDISQLSDEEAAEVIRHDQIDVLVDLTMHMEHGRLLIFARKPAPIQVCWLAYPGTTGLSAIDYRFTDPHIDPPALPSFSAEQPWRLPDTFWCFRPWHPLDQVELPPGPLPALSRGHVTFACLNAFSKTNEATFALWARVLRAVEGSKLLLLVPYGACRRRVSQVFEQAGVSAQRLEYVDYQSPRSAYLAIYQVVDIALDTLPYNGHTTSLDALWMGVPVLSLVGNTIVGRAGLCYARNLQLEGWAIDDADSYVQAARAHASDLAKLAALRAELRDRMERSPLMDSARFAESLEAAYRQMWLLWEMQGPK